MKLWQKFPFSLWDSCLLIFEEFFNDKRIKFPFSLWDSMEVYGRAIEKFTEMVSVLFMRFPGLLISSRWSSRWSFRSLYEILEKFLSEIVEPQDLPLFPFSLWDSDLQVCYYMVLIEFKLTAFGMRLVAGCRDPLYLKSNQFAKFVLTALIRNLTSLVSWIACSYLGKSYS